MARYAVIIVDMLNDFVTGSLGCERGKLIVPDLVKLTRAAREHKIPVIYPMTATSRESTGNSNCGETTPSAARRARK